MDRPSEKPADRQRNQARPGPARTLSARQAALRVLADLCEGRRTARASIDELIRRQQLPDIEVGLATELVMGVLRHQLTLARVLGGCATKGWKRINQRLRHILMLGGYQLIWLDGIPEFAAVNEAVNQAKAEGGTPAGRFVNAILRQLLRDIEDRRIPSERADPSRSLPIDDTYTCQFCRPILPDPAAEPVAHLADSTSHPRWLVSRWVDAFGIEQTRQICNAGMCRPPVLLRPNPLRTDPASLLNRLRDEGFDAELAAAGDAIVVSHVARLTRSAAFAEGLFQPQDRTAMEVVRRMSLTPGMQVIDLCAGPGTKTTQMAEAMGNQGVVLGCDRDESKLRMVRENCERLGHSIVRTVAPSDLEAEADAMGRIDWILVDAPCSNTGVLARRPEARHRATLRSLQSLTRVQHELLDLADRLAGPQTHLCYSTCSIDPAENEELTRDFTRAHPRWRLATSYDTLPAAGPTPGEWRDGGYWAIWERA